MHPCVTRTIHPLVPVAFAFLACIGFNPPSGSASALEPALAPTAGVQTLLDVEYAGAWLAEGEATRQGGHFVCMRAYDDALPVCVQNADGTWDCWGELGELSFRLGTCAAGFGIPAWKAWRAADAAWSAFKAARAAKKGSKTHKALLGEAAAGGAVSVAFSALAAVMGDFLCLDIGDLLDALWDCMRQA